MKQSAELTKIIADVQKIVSHEDDVLGYKVRVRNYEVREALVDLGYVLDYKQGSKKEKTFYQLPAEPTQATTQDRTPANVDSMLEEIGGYIISRKEEEKYLLVSQTRERKTAVSGNPSLPLKPSAGSALEELFFSYPSKPFLHDFEGEEPESKLHLSDRSKYWGKIALNVGIAAVTAFCLYFLAEKLAREIPASSVVSYRFADNKN